MLGLSTLQAAIAGIVLALIASMGGTIWYLHHENGALTARGAVLESDLAIAEAVNVGNEAQLAKIKRDAQEALDAVTRDNAAALARATRTSTLKAEIARAKPSDDAPAAVVLGSVLDRLRQRSAGGADQDPGGAARAAGGAVVVRP